MMVSGRLRTEKLEAIMNSFVTHHAKWIRFVYSCFDRVVFNVIVPSWQCAAVLVGLLQKRRGVQGISRSYLKSVSEEYHATVRTMAVENGIPIVQPPKDVRRDEWVEPFYRRLHGQSGIAVILKCRESARVAVSYATKSGGYHLELCQRFVDQYYFYLQDADFGPMFLRLCPYLPFNGRMVINGHDWLACQMRRDNVRFRQHGNAFLTCSDPERLQQLAGSFSANHVIACAQRWLSQLAPPLIDARGKRAARDYRLFFSQTEFCTNAIFDRRAPLEQLSERLLDLNRDIGRPDKLAIIYGRRINKRTRHGFQTQITDHHLGNPVIRSNYQDQSVKQYVRDHLLLRTEETCYDTRELGINKGLENLPALRTAMDQVNERYQEIQHDVMETFLDRGQLQALRQPTTNTSGRRIPGIKPDDPRVLAVMRALTRFAHIANSDSFRCRDLLEPVAQALGRADYRLPQLRYDLSKLRAKGLVIKLDGTHRYRLTAEGFRLCVLFIKLADRVYKPLTAATLSPIPEDVALSPEKRATLDQNYAAIDLAINNLLDQLGLKAA
jgi:hypothetical protein